MTPHKLLNFIFILLAGCTPLLAAEAADINTITVQGEATVELPPDFVELTFRIIEENNDSERAAERVNQRTNAVLEAIESFSIADEDIAMMGIQLSQKFEFDRNSNADFNGFEASRQITLKLRNFDDYELLAAALINAGIRELSQIQGGIDNQDLIKRTALENAARDARIRAEAIASGLDVGLGAPIVVGENQLRPFPVIQERRMDSMEMEQAFFRADALGGAAGTIPPFFVPGNIQVYATVWVMFELLTD